jgi:alpha-glucosidase
VTGFHLERNGLVLTTPAGALSLTAVNDHVVRVRSSRDGSFARDFSWAVVPGANAPSGTWNVQDDGNAIVAATREIRVRIEKAPLRIVFLDDKNQVLSEDAPGGPMSLGSGFRVEKAMPDDAHYFGLGDKAGPLDRRDMAFTHWNEDAYGWEDSTDPLYKSIPFFISLRKGTAHGIFLDNTSGRGNLDALVSADRFCHLRRESSQACSRCRRFGEGIQIRRGEEDVDHHGALPEGGPARVGGILSSGAADTRTAQP